ncbi:deoxyribonuclease IV [Hominifimenecus sp. rT4P-3]|uniref:deoxyribonuclease IV n=1 Tax=Hominifimenecus sp. rT4P-3 TaxID=3242979 RepID=UPI003DA67AA1
MLMIGSHISSSKGYEAMGKQALKLGANTFAFFTRNPRGGSAKALDLEDVKRFLEIAEEHSFGPLVAHAPYTLNPCAAKPEVLDFSRRAMGEDLEKLEALPGNYYNFHPGSHVGQGLEVGISRIAELLNQILTSEQSTMVLLETMAGKGSEVGGRFEDLARIREQVERREKVGVCLDTCHVWDGGYDIVHDLDGVLAEFDRVIGLEHLKAIHLNDSQNPMGSHKDRHAKIGEGTIGLSALCAVINHPLLRKLPFVLETPNDEEGYAREIHMLRERYRDE